MKKEEMLVTLFNKACDNAFKYDPCLLSPRDCVVKEPEGSLVKRFKKEDTEAFEAVGVHRWFCSTEAYVVAIPTKRKYFNFTFVWGLSRIIALVEMCKAEVLAEKEKMDVFHFFIPVLEVKRTLFGYKITLETTFLSGRYID